MVSARDQCDRPEVTCPAQSRHMTVEDLKDFYVRQGFVANAECKQKRSDVSTECRQGDKIPD